MIVGHGGLELPRSNGLVELPPYSRVYPSDDYLHSMLAARETHRGKIFDGTRSFHIFPTLKSLCLEHKIKTLLDFGAGKGLQYSSKNFRVEGVTYFSLEEACGFKATCYDPAWQPFSALPTGQYDAVLSNDVLQFVPLTDMDWILREIFSYATKFVLLQVACELGKKKMGDQLSRDQGRSTELWCTVVTKIGLEYPNIDWILRIRAPKGAVISKCSLYRRRSGEAVRFAGYNNLTFNETSGRAEDGPHVLPTEVADGQAGSAALSAGAQK